MADAVTENPMILNIMPSYGAIIIGILISCTTWGISCMQCFLYFLNYEKDYCAIRALIIFVWLLDTANQILMMKSVFPVLILQWGGITGLRLTEKELVHHMWVSSVVAISVQMFFLWRIYVFSGNRWVFPALMMPFLLYQLIGAIPMVINNLRNLDLSTVMTPKSVALIESFRSVSAGIDIVIAVLMCWLVTHGDHASIKHSRRLIFRLVILTVNTGVWTAFSALMTLILLLLYPSTLYYAIFELPLSGLYANSLLGNLNARRYIRGASGGGDYNTHISPTSGRGVALSSPNGNEGNHLVSLEHALNSRVETSKAIEHEEDSKFPHI